MIVVLRPGISAGKKQEPRADRLRAVRKAALA